MLEEVKHRLRKELYDLTRDKVKTWNGSVTLHRCEYYVRDWSPVCAKSQSTFWSASLGVARTYCQNNLGLTSATFYVGKYIAIHDRISDDFLQFVHKLAQIAVKAGFPLAARTVQEWETLHGSGRTAWPGDLYTHIVQHLIDAGVWHWKYTIMEGEWGNNNSTTHRAAEVIVHDRSLISEYGQEGGGTRRWQYAQSRVIGPPPRTRKALEQGGRW